MAMLCAQDLVDEWVSQEVDSWLHAVQELCDRTVRKAEGGIIREMLAEAADVARREAAILTLQCFFRRRLAIKRARHQVRKRQGGRRGAELPSL